MTCKLKLLVLEIISLITRMMATTHKKIKKIAITFIRSETPVTPSREARDQEDLSSTTPTHVPMITEIII